MIYVMIWYLSFQDWQCGQTDTIDRPVLIGTLHVCKCTWTLLVNYDDKKARTSGLVLTGFLVISSNLAETSLPFLGRIRTNTVPTSGHTRSSFSTSAMPRKPVAPVMKMFFPLKKSLTGLLLSSVSAMVERVGLLACLASLQHIKYNINTSRLSVYFLCPHEEWAGIVQAVWRLAMAWTVRGLTPGEGQDFPYPPDWPWGPPNLLYNGCRVIPGSKAVGVWP